MSGLGDRDSGFRGRAAVAPEAVSTPRLVDSSTPRLGVYVHFPFCLAKCAYCDFASYPLATQGGLEGARGYLEALFVEIDRRAASDEFAGAVVDTIYLGGGTPTVLPAAWLEETLTRLRARFAVSPEAEVTVEANPGTVDAAKLQALRAAGVNRLSLGVQSFSDDALRRLGRVHTAEEAKQELLAARAAGFDNLGLDLIYAQPGQTLAEWQTDVEEALSFAPEHLSAYGLTLEEGTALTQSVASGVLPEPKEARYNSMYRWTERRLRAAGYRHYEISNYARPGRESQHNRRYWQGDEYLGLGSSAHSYRGGIRWNNWPEPDVYRASLLRGLLPVAGAETLSARERVGEMLMLGLRGVEGVSAQAIEARTGLRPEAVFGAEFAALQERGLLIVSRGRIRIPRRKWLLSDEALLAFVR